MDTTGSTLPFVGQNKAMPNSIRGAGDFGKRLVELLERNGQQRRGAGAYLAKRYRVSSVTANDWLNGKFKPDPETARKIAADHGSHFLFLYFGKRPEHTGVREEPAAYDPSPYPGTYDPDLQTGLPTAELDSIHRPASPDEIAPGYVRFPLLDGFVAAGEGGYVADYPEVVRDIDVAEEWARRNLAAPPSRIRVITAQGDSMAPDIGSGDVLFVDSGITWFDSDAVYVMNWQGRPIVKRLQMRRDGRLLIKSANPAYEPEEVAPGETDQLHISGRVIGVWHFRKY